MGQYLKQFIIAASLLFLIVATAVAQDTTLTEIIKQVRSGEELEIRPGKSEWSHGILFWSSKDGDFYGRFDVRAYINGAYFFENLNPLSNGTHLRKGRLAIKMQLWRNWRTEWDIDVAEGVVEIKDMWLSYRGIQNSHIKFGHFKVPFGLEILTSSRYIPFAERAYNALAFKMGRRVGLEYSRWGERWNVRADLFGQTMDIKKNKTKDETGGGFAARFAAVPIMSNTLTVHTGIAAVWERPDDNAWIVDYNAEPETKIGDVEILDTDLIKNTSHTYRFGLEGAVVYKNLHVQAEYQMVQVHRFNNLPTANFKGGYIYALYTLTGEKRPWDPTQGEFSQLLPASAGLGAWEVGLRYSHLFLTDTDAQITGGAANNYTAALNWYPNSNMVFQTNFTQVVNSENATGNGFIGGDTFSYIQFMVKFFF
ncbi:MAG TPA: hypothetical protein ENK44_03215 [Caldithrix abyssi]|uniref:Porin n=1 Tax=Caldithrix abyssi TaxID=187145 RepID=A0A7V4TYH7_CALAY|nr:hypothetical protein [Caldithrix abyssi]